MRFANIQCFAGELIGLQRSLRRSEISSAGYKGVVLQEGGVGEERGRGGLGKKKRGKVSDRGEKLEQGRRLAKAGPEAMILQ